MARRKDELHPVERAVLQALEQTLTEVEATERYRIDIQPADPTNEAPAILSLVATESPPIRVQVDHESQVTVYFDKDDRIVELYESDPEALLTELADVVSTSIRE